MRRLVKTAPPQKPALPDLQLDASRIVMRPPRMEDWPAWAEVRWRNYTYLKPFEPTWPRQCLGADFFERRLTRQCQDWEQDKGRYFLILKKDVSAGDPHNVIGGMNVNNICRGAAHFASLGYWIDEKHQGQGYMAEAMRLICRYAFEDLEFHRLHGACIPDNVRSQNVLLKAGFKEEGFAEKYLKIDGIWQDHILYGLTVERWLAGQG